MLSLGWLSCLAISLTVSLALVAWCALDLFTASGGFIIGMQALQAQSSSSVTHVAGDCRLTDTAVALGPLQAVDMWCCCRCWVQVASKCVRLKTPDQLHLCNTRTWRQHGLPSCMGMPTAHVLLQVCHQSVGSRLVLVMTCPGKHGARVTDLVVALHGHHQLGSTACWETSAVCLLRNSLSYSLLCFNGCQKLCWPVLRLCDLPC